MEAIQENDNIHLLPTYSANEGQHIDADDNGQGGPSNLSVSYKEEQQRSDEDKKKDDIKDQSPTTAKQDQHAVADDSGQGPSNLTVTLEKQQQCSVEIKEIHDIGDQPSTSSAKQDQHAGTDDSGQGPSNLTVTLEKQQQSSGEIKQIDDIGDQPSTSSAKQDQHAGTDDSGQGSSNLIATLEEQQQCGFMSFATEDQQVSTDDNGRGSILYDEEVINSNSIQEKEVSPLSKAELEANEKLFEGIRDILNTEITHRAMYVLYLKKKLAITTKAQMDGVANVIFEKVITNPESAKACANLCRALQSISVQVDEKHKVIFRNLIITKTQHRFQNPDVDSEDYDDLIGLRIEVLGCTDPVKKAKLQMSILQRRFAIDRFIGELYNVDLLTERILIYCMNTLIDKITEENFERLYVLLDATGEVIDKGTLENIIKEIQNPVEDQNNELSDGTRDMLRKFIEKIKKNNLKENMISYQNLQNESSNNPNNFMGNDNHFRQYQNNHRGRNYSKKNPSNSIIIWNQNNSREDSSNFGWNQNNSRGESSNSRGNQNNYRGKNNHRGKNNSREHPSNYTWNRNNSREDSSNFGWNQNNSRGEPTNSRENQNNSRGNKTNFRGKHNRGKRSE